jgi:hypothetical protein
VATVEAADFVLEMAHSYTLLILHSSRVVEKMEKILLVSDIYT